GSTVPINPTFTPFTVADGPGNVPITVAPNSPIVVDGTILTAGGPAATIDGTVVSLASGSSYLVVGGSTVPINPTFTPFTVADGPGNVPITVAPNSPIVVDGTILTAGGPAATIDGTVVSLASGSSYLVVGSSTIPISPAFTPFIITNG